LSACEQKTARRCFRGVVARAESASLFSGGGALPTVQARSEALPKNKRLAKRREFLHVYETGRKLFSRYCVLFFAANDLPYSRLGVTATKKLGKANVRNRLKRWTREVYRRQREPLGLDARALDVVVNVKPNAAAAKFDDYSSDLQLALRRIVSEDAR
jgi:ribonuclease P protein component